jgi:FOG: FHA domain
MTSGLATEAGYVPGPWVGMAGRHIWLLADLDPADPVVTACWDLVRSGATVDALLTAVAGGAAQHVAIVRLHGRRADVAVQGDAWVAVSTGDGETAEVRSAAGGVASRTVEPVTVARLHAAGEEATAGEGASLPLGTGVVTAARIVVRSTPAGEPDTTTPDSPDSGRVAGQLDSWLEKTVLPESEPEQAVAAPPEWLPGAARSTAAASTLGPTEDPAGGLAASSATLPPEHTSTTVGPDAYRSPFEGPFAGSVGPGGVHPGPVAPSGVHVGPAAPPGSVHAGPAAPSASVPGDIIADVSWAIVPDDGEAPAYPPPSPYPPPAPAPSAPPVAPPTPHATAAPGYEPAPTRAYPLPGSPVAPFAGSPPFPAPTQPASGGLDPELMQTTRRTSAHSGTTGPIVGAVRCGDGHPNPPAAQHCRVCTKPIPPQTPQPIPRPTLGVLRLSTGEVVPLDKGVILGRAPGSPQGFGPDEPHRIQLPSPDGSISRRHVEVVLEGWLVTVVDLDSTNGTVVTPPGGRSERLPRGGRKVIENGWVVSLDDTTWFRFEVTP